MPWEVQEYGIKLLQLSVYLKLSFPQYSKTSQTIFLTITTFFEMLTLPGEETERVVFGDSNFFFWY